MKIKWTPFFDAPKHRRLELISMGLVVFCEILLGPLCIFIILCLLVTFQLKIFFKQNFNAKSNKHIFAKKKFLSIFSSLETFIREQFVYYIWHLFIMIVRPVTMVDVEQGKCEKISLKMHYVQRFNFFSLKYCMDAKFKCMETL